MQPGIPRLRPSTFATFASAPWKSCTTTQTICRGRQPLTEISARPPEHLALSRTSFPPAAMTPWTFMAGFTPMIKARNLGKRLGLNNLYIKNDSVNPSYSFKDRVVSVATTKAIGSSDSRPWPAPPPGTWPAASLPTPPAPESAPSSSSPRTWSGVRSSAPLCTAPRWSRWTGTYDEVNRLCSEVGDNYPWAFVNINMRPYYAEGSKTLGYEVAEQLGWRLPDHVVVPSASGAMFTKIWKGFNELACLGPGGRRGRHDLRRRPEHRASPRRHHPKMHMAQAEGLQSPIVTAWVGRPVPRSGR